MWLKIPIDLDTKAANTHLLKELDRWKELGLLSEDQILSIGQELCSRLPIIYKATATPEGTDEEATAEDTKAHHHHSPTATATRLLSGFKSRLVQSFLAEMTVLWLLFLGVGTQLVGTASARKQRTYLSSWHYIPMTYGVLGLALGHGRFTATTGLYSLAVGMLLLVISQRYLLRCLATLLIGLTAIFQAEIAAPMFIGISLIISFGLIGFGLFRRVRAYLYIGTLTFMLQILRTIMIFIDTDGRMLWAVGILLGITLIWIAATFESRRAQIHSLLNQWSAILANWE